MTEKAPSAISYLKAGLEAGMKAEAEARQVAMQNAVFMVFRLVNRL